MSMPLAAGHFPAVPPPTRRGRSRLVIGITVALLLGAAGIVVAVVVAGGPKAAALGFTLAAIPVGPLIASYLWLDRYEPEPLGVLLTALGWGAVVATSGSLAAELAVVRLFDPPEEVTGAVVAPIVEEALKGLMLVLLVVARRRHLDGPLDGIVYAGMVGIGFAFTENAFYYVAAYLGELDPTHQLPSGAAVAGGVFIVRGVMAPFAHPLFTAAVGIGIGLAVVTRRRWLRVVAPPAGFIVAVGLHAAWNGSVLLIGAGGFFLTYLLGMVPAFALAITFAVWGRQREGRVLAAALYECARLGWLHPGEIRWIARLPDRAAARRYARHARGADAASAVKEYQQAATELAFLRWRLAHGTARAEDEQRQCDLLARMRTWRPFVVLPPLVVPHPSAPPVPVGPH